MASSSSRMSLASSRAVALVLSSARSAASGAAMSLPRLAERLVDARPIACPGLPGDDGGYLLAADLVEVEVYLLGSPKRGRFRGLHRSHASLGQWPGVPVPCPAGQNGCQTGDGQKHG